MAADTAISPGLPVEVGEIERQLGLLWEHSDAGKVRASLVNLVVYSEAPDAIKENTALLAGVAAGHACRALLVSANPRAKETSARAWITAHCHTGAGGKKEVCSEQITFALEGEAAGRLPNIVFSHLDTDLPLYLWWQGALHPSPDPQLWRWVDRLIVDSDAWEDPARQFGILRDIEELGRGRCAVCDLTWTRLFHLRYAVAQIFDLPAAASRAGQIRSVAIEHGPGHRITALQLLGWMASRLGWKREGKRFAGPGGEVRFELREGAAAGWTIGDVQLDFGDARAHVRRDAGEDFYVAEFNAPGMEPCSQMLPAGRETTVDILLSELSRGSRHPLYWPAIRAIEPLL